MATINVTRMVCERPLSVAVVQHVPQTALVIVRGFLYCEWSHIVQRYCMASPKAHVINFGNKALLDYDFQKGPVHGEFMDLRNFGKAA